ncbi:MAG: TonB-dependent receptor [Betaproteobacteria bacterium]
MGFLDDPVSGVSANITTVDQANPNLKPEESDTYTVGFVLTPASIPGLSLAMDYYSIKIEGAISSGLGASQLVDACIASNGTSADCDQVIRRTPTSFPDFVIAQEGNFAAFETAGIDVELSYTTQAFGGELGLHGYLNYLDTYTEQTYPTSPVLDYRGAGHITGSLGSGRPEFMGTLNVTYKRNAFSAALTEQYIHSLDLKTVGNPAAKFNPNSINAVNYIDLSLMYDFGFGDSKAQAFVTINNLMDKEPPLVPTTLPSSSPVTIIGVYDHIGRAYVAGIRMEL